MALRQEVDASLADGTDIDVGSQPWDPEPKKENGSSWLVVQWNSQDCGAR